MGNDIDSSGSADGIYGNDRVKSSRNSVDVCRYIGRGSSGRWSLATGGKNDQKAEVAAAHDSEFVLKKRTDGLKIGQVLQYFAVHFVVGEGFVQEAVESVGPIKDLTD